MNKKTVLLLLAAHFGLFSAVLIALAAGWQLHRQAPVQPVAFPHPTHVDKLGLDCQYCHQFAGEAAHPGIPPLELCMECHEQAATDRPEIIKLAGYWNRKEAVPWIKVHQLPWHANFTHKRHVRAGVDCVNCHGEIRAAARVRQVHALEMGWCVNCHRSRQVTVDCTVCHK